jgi:hypothetical protein
MLGPGLALWSSDFVKTWGRPKPSLGAWIWLGLAQTPAFGMNVVSGPKPHRYSLGTINEGGSSQELGKKKT